MSDVCIHVKRYVTPAASIGDRLRIRYATQSHANGSNSISLGIHTNILARSVNNRTIVFLNIILLTFR